MQVTRITECILLGGIALIELLCWIQVLQEGAKHKVYTGAFFLIGIITNMVAIGMILLS